MEANENIIIQNFFFFIDSFVNLFNFDLETDD